MKNSKSPRWMDHVFRWSTLGFALIVVLIMLWMIFALAKESRLSIEEFGLKFIIDKDWNPVQGQFGALPFIYGTVLSSAIAILIATPISVGAALFLTEMSPKWLRSPIGFLIELLAAIPSILFGLWGLYVFVPFVRNNIQKPISSILDWFPLFSGAPIGLGMLSAGLLLAIMIIPIITALTRDVISAVPNLQKEGALALGATRWEMIWKVVLPYSRAGILGAVIMGLGRALGETMAVTMVIGNRAEIHPSLFAPGHSMAAVIANEFTEAVEDIYLSSLIEIGLLLFLVTFILNALARYLIWKVARGPEGGMRRMTFRSLRYRKTKNIVMLCIVVLFTLIALIPLVSIVGYIVYKGYSALNWSFFVDLPNPPGEPGGGVGNAIVGTLELIAISSVVGLPVGIFTAVYLNEYGRTGWFSGSVRFIIDVMLGIPSIVVGIFAFLAFVRPFGTFSALSGGLALAIMMIPIVARSTEGILKLVPDSLREGAYALGVSKWRTIVSIVIPYAIKGIVTGVMLGVARVAGETAPLLLTAFGNLHWAKGILEPTASLPAQIFEYAKSPYEDWIQKAWGAAMVLIMLVLSLNILARVLTRSRFKKVS